MITNTKTHTFECDLVNSYQRYIKVNVAGETISIPKSQIRAKKDVPGRGIELVIPHWLAKAKKIISK